MTDEVVESAAPATAEPAATGATAAVQPQTAVAAEAPAEAGAKADEPPADPLAAYADLKVELADGLPIDEAGLAALKEFAAKSSLAPEAVQGFLDLYAGQVQAQYEAHAAEVAAWAEAVKTDPEIGGDKLNASLATAHKARDAFGTPELVEVLDAYGLGNHPAVVKFFVNAGRAISEDVLVQGSSGAAPTRNAAQVLFPSMN